MPTHVWGWGCCSHASVFHPTHSVQYPSHLSIAAPYHTHHTQSRLLRSPATVTWVGTTYAPHRTTTVYTREPTTFTSQRSLPALSVARLHDRLLLPLLLCYKHFGQQTAGWLCALVRCTTHGLPDSHVPCLPSPSCDTYISTPTLPAAIHTSCPPFPLGSYMSLILYKMYNNILLRLIRIVTKYVASRCIFGPSPVLRICNMFYSIEQDMMHRSIQPRSFLCILFVIAHKWLTACQSWIDFVEQLWL